MKSAISIHKNWHRLVSLRGPHCKGKGRPWKLGWKKLREQKTPKNMCPQLSWFLLGARMEWTGFAMESKMENAKSRKTTNFKVLLFTLAWGLRHERDVPWKIKLGNVLFNKNRQLPCFFRGNEYQGVSWNWR